MNGRVSGAADPTLLRRAVLTDGGVYDNQGLQPLLDRCRTLLVSDGGAPWLASTSGFYRWTSQLKRVHYMADSQVRALRRRDLIERFMRSADSDLMKLPANSPIRRRFALRGAYWPISSNPGHYPANTGGLSHIQWRRLADIGTWLHFLGARETEDLVNWGYFISDLALRSYVDPSIPIGASPPVASGRIRPGWRAGRRKAQTDVPGQPRVQTGRQLIRVAAIDVAGNFRSNSSQALRAAILLG